LQKSITDPEFDPSGSVRKALKYARKWHMVTDKHHIIANNIMLNSNFANEVRAGNSIVRFDPELRERRTRHADREIPESLLDREVKLMTYLSSLLAEEIRNMYRGQLILTGNAEIEPHDIIFIFDEVRHIHGAIEAAKVQHIFNQEMGFITIVEPHLIVEQGGYGMTAAIAMAKNSMVRDFGENSKTVAGRLANSAAIGVAKGGLNNPLSNFVGQFLNSFDRAAETAPEAVANYILTQIIVPYEARNHPLTIYPLVKRTAPWLSGLEGASGRGLIGVIGNTVIKSIKAVRNAAKVIRNFEQLGQTAVDIMDYFDTENIGGGRVIDPKVSSMN